MRTFLRGKKTLLFLTLGLLIAIPAAALASDVATAVVDAEAPTGEVTVSQGNSGNFTINMSVSGKQDGTATFKVYRDWTLSGGSFSKTSTTADGYLTPETFNVPVRAAGADPTTFSTTGKVRVDSGQAAGGPFTLAFGAEEITNSNATGAKLSAGTSSNYKVTVQAATDPCASVVDPAAPVISATPNTPNGNDPWYTSIPTGISATSATNGATITYATEVNGGAKSAYSSTAPTLGQGTTVVYAKATSATCDKVTESSREFNVDTNAPTVDPAGVVNSTWRNTDLSQAFTASDGVSGLADAINDASFTLTASAESANASTPTVVSRTVSDVAGNSTTRSVSAKIDKTNPNVNCGSADANWHATDVSIACTASDVLSGLADNANDASFNLTTSVDANTETSNASTNSRNVLDNATNSTQAGPITGIKVDKRDPTFSDCTGGPFTQGSGSHTVSINATDNGSGVDNANSTLSGSVDTNTIGTKTFTFTATDNVANSDTKVCSYDVDYNWTGFFQPIDNKDTNGNYIPNKAKAGSVIPVKFSLKGNQGDQIFVTGSPSVVGATGCATGTSDLVEEYAPANASGLKYDPIADQYIYNWKTQSNYAGKCLQLNVTLSDNTTHSALFSFVK